MDKKEIKQLNIGILGAFIGGSIIFTYNLLLDNYNIFVGVIGAIIIFMILYFIAYKIVKKLK